MHNGMQADEILDFGLAKKIRADGVGSVQILRGRDLLVRLWEWQSVDGVYRRVYRWDIQRPIKDESEMSEARHWHAKYALMQTAIIETAAAH